MAARGRISHVIGFDDAPFERSHRGDVSIVGAVYAGSRLEGVLTGKVRRDGANATRAIAALVGRSRFARHLQLVMLQGIAVAGFNIIDIQALQKVLGVPVLVIMRRRPDLRAIEHALLTRVRGGRRKWRLIQRAGDIEPAAGVYVQRAGINLATAEQVIRRFAVSSDLPEPLRTAHIVAGAMETGDCRHRV
jgi:endonuclease V-like protein UPF0215 family